MGDQPSNRLQTMLQTAVQSVGWTYSLFWHLCPQQGILVWGDGYYNGAIKTRKTVQPLMEFSTEEASLHRSEQLRELYDSLAATTTTGSADINQQPAARRPSAALSPEDLTESEWFYLMCVSFSFPPGVGLPGKAYARRKHVWLTGATDVDSKVFSRALLAKSARVQTVVCIPSLDGVIELGTTEKVQEDLGFVKRVMTFFTDHTSWSFPPKPALSGHSSTSNLAISPTMPPPAIYTPPVVPMDQELEDDLQEHEEDEIDDNKEVGEDDDQEDELDGEEEEDDDDEEEEEEEAAESDDAEAETGYIDSRFSTVQILQAMADHNQDHDANTTSTDHHAVVEPNELHDLSEGIRFGSPDDGSNYLDSDFHMLAAVRQAENFESELQQQGYIPFSPKHCLQLPGAPQPEELTQEDTHYSHTVSTILHHQSNRCSDASTVSRYAIYSTQSAFAKWKSPPPILHHPGPSQWVLKYVLFTIPYLHTTKSRDGAAAVESATRFRKGDDTNHVLAERRRREKLNERFIILRSLVPFVTKMDKASILGDTIEYLKQLRKRIQDLEAREGHSTGSSVEKRKVRKMDGTVIEKTKVMMEAASAGEVEVSIIESDALVEMQCPYREGLLLDVMEVLRELRVEITTVQSSLNGRLFTAEMRAKVKENVSGKKLSIMEVKRAINQVIPKNY